MDEMGETNPARAVRAKARALVQEFVRTFGGTPPLNLGALASFRGLMASEEAPRHSLDSEIAPENGRVVLRINRERPYVRQRFSTGHEIGHTLFPDYQLKVQCRKPPDRDWAEPSDLIETLCDIAASEFLFPSPWFDNDVNDIVLSAAGLRDLAARYEASTEATVRRFVEVSTLPLAAVFCSWKLKPTEIRQDIADRHQGRIFGDTPQPSESKLRVDYSIANDRFRALCRGHIPKDKSVLMDGPIAEASVSHEPRDGTMRLDFGPLAKEFLIAALPVYTPPERSGPNGASSVVIVLQPHLASG